MTHRIPKWVALCGIACLLLLATIAVAPTVAPGPVADAIEWLQAHPGDGQPASEQREPDLLARAAESAWATLYGPDGFLKEKTECVPLSANSGECLSPTTVSTSDRGAETRNVATASKGAVASAGFGASMAMSGGGGAMSGRGGENAGGAIGGSSGGGGPSASSSGGGSAPPASSAKPNTVLASLGDAAAPATYSDKSRGGGVFDVPPAGTELSKTDGPVYSGSPDNPGSPPAPLLEPPVFSGPTGPNGPPLPDITPTLPNPPAPGAAPGLPIPGGWPDGPGIGQGPLPLPPGLSPGPLQPPGVEQSAGLDPAEAVVTIIDVTIKEQNGPGATPTVTLVTAAAISEPSTALLGLLALLFIGFTRRRTIAR